VAGAVLPAPYFRAADAAWPSLPVAVKPDLAGAGAGREDGYKGAIRTGRLQEAEGASAPLSGGLP